MCEQPVRVLLHQASQAMLQARLSHHGEDGTKQTDKRCVLIMPLYLLFAPTLLWHHI
jgi:hypothetical protein